MNGRRSRGQILVLLVSFLLVLTALPVVSAQDPGVSGKVEPLLHQKLAAEGRADFVVRFVERADLSPAYTMDWPTRGRFVYAALKETAARTQEQAKVYLDGRGLAHHTFVAANELYVWGGDLLAVNELAVLPEVASLRAPRTYSVDPVQVNGVSPEAVTSWGLIDSGAEQFWAAFGRQGDGIIVASVGTGVQWDHPALVNRFHCPGSPSDPACWEDPSDICGGSACDNNGHGTHTTGTMVAEDDQALPYLAGMAPNAQWIACKGCETSACSQFALNTCADWILAPDGDPDNRPHVAYNGWGGAGCDDWFLPQVQAWNAAGILAVFTPGNSGPNCDTLVSPGDYQESFAAVAHDDTRTIGAFSSRGPSCYGHDPYTKPNLSAPGVSICSPLPPNSWQCWSGSAMSAAHAAGAVALLWSCNAGLIGQVPQTFEALQDTAALPPSGGCGAPPDGEGNYTYGYGFLDVLAAGQSVCTSQWTPGPGLCFDLTRFDAEFHPGDGMIYVLGGRSGTDTDGNIYRFDPRTGACADTGADMPTPISNYTIALLNDGSADLLCSFGGRAADGSQTLDVQCYDPATNSAAVVAQLPNAYAGYVPGGVAVVDNRAYIFGGFGPSMTPYELARTDRYNPETHTFAQIGDLSLARSYIDVAVVNGRIYAFGGTVFDGAGLVAQTRAEVMAYPGGAGTWNDAAVADLPVASAEGRAFGFDTSSGYPYGGQVVIAGGGQWPGETEEALLYDVASDSYIYAFPDLIDARRDHAGAFVPLCSLDPADGLPGMWVFGGRQGTDNPPYMPAEYLPLPCVPLECPLYGNAQSAVLSTWGSAPLQGGRMRGHFGTTDFQAINLSLDEQLIAARFLAPNGQQVHVFSSTIPGGASFFYDPQDSIPVGFTGTLVLETPGRAAVGVLHLEELPQKDGSTVFPGVADENLGSAGYTPIDGCTRLYVHNLHPGVPAEAVVYVFDLPGALVAEHGRTIPPLGTITVDPIEHLGLSPDFAGSAVIVADQPIAVTAHRTCDGFAALVAPARCAPSLYVPHIPPGQPGVQTTTLQLQNPSPSSNWVDVVYSLGPTQPVFLPAWSGAVLEPPLEGGSARIHSYSGQPVVAVVRSVSREPATQGVLAYRAFAREEASPAAALPILFPGYRGWVTGDNLWVMNLGTMPTQVRIRYVTAPTGTVAWNRGTVGPGQVWQVAVPDLPAERAAAILLADQDQPIVALTGGFNPIVVGGEGPTQDPQDRQIGYPGVNFPFEHTLVGNPTFVYTITGGTVAFAGSASGSEPITYLWDFGDGAMGQGQAVVHSYAAPGNYAVVMTATNVWGFGVAEASATLTIVCQEVEIREVITQAVGCVVTFAADVTGMAPLTYAWDFGPFGPRSVPTPTINFVQTGTYSYTLSMSNCGGAGQDDVSGMVTVACAAGYWVYLPVVTKTY